MKALKEREECRSFDEDLNVTSLIDGYFMRGRK
jgi:hypothetical protein